LRDHFASFGDIKEWIQFQTWKRILVIYAVEDAAEKAMLSRDPLPLGGGRSITLSVGLGPMMIIPQEMSYLQPPRVEKNFLISPPGSPPIGWEQAREGPPNSTTLASDLIVALRKLEMHEKGRRKPTFEQLIDPMDGAGIGICVEYCDEPEDEFGLEVMDEGSDYGETSLARQNCRPVPTSLPPMNA
jgi:hypothetical protein